MQSLVLIATLIVSASAAVAAPLMTAEELEKAIESAGADIKLTEIEFKIDGQLTVKMMAPAKAKFNYPSVFAETSLGDIRASLLLGLVKRVQESGDKSREKEKGWKLFAETKQLRVFYRTGANRRYQLEMVQPVGYVDCHVESESTSFPALLLMIKSARTLKLAKQPASAAEALRDLGWEVTETSLKDSGPASNRALALAKEFKGLKELFLVSEEIDDEGLVHLAGLEKLETLKIWTSGVKGPGLVHLKGLPSLNYLDLFGNAMQDDGFKHLPPLPKLEFLRLTGTRVTDESLAHVGKFTSLGTLDLGSTEFINGRFPVFKGSGLKHLKTLTKLTEFRLDENPITDESIADLAPLTELKILDLTETAVTDKCVVHLGKLKKLQWVILRKTNVTAEGVAELKKMLPGLEVSK